MLFHVVVRGSGKVDIRCACAVPDIKKPSANTDGQGIGQGNERLIFAYAGVREAVFFEIVAVVNVASVYYDRLGHRLFQHG